MMVYLDQKLDERTSLTGIIESLRDRAAAEERDLTEQERSEITRLQERCVELDAMLTEHANQTESAHNFANLQRRIEASQAAGRAETRSGAGSTVETSTPGQSFVESEQFRSYPGRGQGQSFEITGYTGILETRALITTANLAIPHVVLPPREQVVPIPPLLQVVDVQTVSGGVAEWVEVGPDPEAAIVPEGTAKPEAALVFTPRTSALDTYAHWVQITRQALSDAVYVRSLVETKLRRGVLRKIATEIQAAITAATLPTADGPTLLAAIRNGVGTVEAAGYAANAVLLNPADWAALDVDMQTNTLNGAVVGQSFWGLRPISSTSQPAGTATVGDFQSGVSYLDRNVTDVFLTDSHADFFIKNILVILAEARGKAVVPEPAALCECAAAVIP
jgi:HK97 family phage major capsid protein